MVWGLTAGICVIALLIWVAQGFPAPPIRYAQSAGGALAVPAALFYAMVFSTVGLLLAVHRTRNPIGWIFLAIGLPMALTDLSHRYLVAAFERGAVTSTDTFVAWLNSSFHTPYVGFLVLLVFLLFPDGRPAAGWQRIAWLGFASAVLGGVATALRPGEILWYPGMSNPFAVPVELAEVFTAATMVALLGGLLSLGLAIAYLRRGYRDASPDRRVQLRWVFYAAAVVAASSIPFIVLEYAVGGAQVLGTVVTVMLAVSTALPVTTAIAVTRYRLYDIDVLISRTVVYALLTGILGGVFAALLAVLERLSLALTGATSDAVIIVASVLVASLIAPGRKALETLVDERFKPSGRARSTATGAGPATDDEAPAALEKQLAELTERVRQMETAMDDHRDGLEDRLVALEERARKPGP